MAPPKYKNDDHLILTYLSSIHPSFYLRVAGLEYHWKITCACFACLWGPNRLPINFIAKSCFMENEIEHLLMGKNNHRHNLKIPYRIRVSQFSQSLDVFKIETCTYYRVSLAWKN